jgi:glutaredoxin-like protein
MALLDDKTRQDVRALLADIAGDVKILVFTQEFECQFCKETRQIVEEVASLSDRIACEVYDFQGDEEKVQKHDIDKIPAIALLGAGGEDYGVRYYGIPSGYEFSSFLHDIKAVAAGPQGVGLSPETIEALNALASPVHLQVFVTPTCPYCPQAVTLANAMAIASKNVRADMVEATEFPHLSQRYNVMAVPRTVVNEDAYVEGAVPEAMLLEKIKSAVK